MHNYGFVDLENEELYVFSGEPMARNAEHFLQVCKDDKRLVWYAKGGGGEPTRKGGKRMGQKRFKSSDAALSNTLQSKFGST
jgi:hypothetical protein